MTSHDSGVREPTDVHIVRDTWGSITGIGDRSVAIRESHDEERVFQSGLAGGSIDAEWRGSVLGEEVRN